MHQQKDLKTKPDKYNKYQKQENLDQTNKELERISLQVAIEL